MTKQCEARIKSEPGVQLEYFEIVNGENLHTADQNSKQIVALVAAKAGNTRLIDNMIIKN
jgi:pantoate--beta-alanine ligase